MPRKTSLKNLVDVGYQKSPSITKEARFYGSQKRRIYKINLVKYVFVFLDVPHLVSKNKRLPF